MGLVGPGYICAPWRHFLHKQSGVINVLLFAMRYSFDCLHCQAFEVFCVRLIYFGHSISQRTWVLLAGSLHVLLQDQSNLTRRQRDGGAN
jgi:hypothetical protein